MNNKTTYNQKIKVNYYIEQKNIMNVKKKRL